MSDFQNSRRQFLQALSLGTGAALVGACTYKQVSIDNGAATPPSPVSRAPGTTETGLPQLPDGLRRDNFHVHNERPLALETRRSALTSAALTPASLLFVRNNLPMPDPSVLQDRDGWVLRVKGVGRESQITLAELKNLGRETVTAVLQCSGNGRAFFEHEPSGSQWSVGAAGCVNWTGVRLGKVAEFLGGAKEGMKFVTATGGEPLPEGVEASTVVVERSIPIEKGLDDVLLAWELNGAPMPITHGGPLRMVVPGYFGCNQIKYVKTVAFTEHETDAKIQRKGYRFRPLGEGGDPTQPSMWRMPVKSWVNGPGADDTPVLAGNVHFHGVAFSGERGVEKVEVSLDNGETWQQAEIYGPDMGNNAWRTFRFSSHLDPGDHRIVSRATDTAGDVQPAERAENERGYRYNAWREAGLVLRVVKEQPHPSKESSTAPAATPAAAPTKAVSLSERGEAGKTVFAQTTPSCETCHTLQDAGAIGDAGPNLDVLKPGEETVINAVTHGVGVMPSFGDSLSQKQISELARYIVEATR